MTDRRPGARATGLADHRRSAAGAAAGDPGGFTLLEAIIATFILLVAVPPLIDTAMTVARMDKGRESRSNATSLTHVALEQLRYRVYNDDRRGYRLNDTLPQKIAAYQTLPAGYLRYGDALQEGERWIVDTPVHGSEPQNRYYSRLFSRDNPDKRYPWRDSDPRPTIVPGGLSASTHPELAREVESFSASVATQPYVASTDPDLRNKGPDQPKVDVCDVQVGVRWRDLRGREQSQVVTTRILRDIYEWDPTLSTSGGN